MTTRDTLVQILDCLCPMHLLLDVTGHIVQAGPTLQKLRPRQDLKDMRFLEVFELTRPRAITTMSALMRTSGAKLHLRFRDAPDSGLKGVLICLPDRQGAIVNLSFGISVLDAVRDHALTSADFSATDLAIELLYLVEAKSAVMAESRKLNQRLQSAMVAAEEQAFTDTLTGLKNRRALDHVLARQIAAGVPFALMHLDLDHFKVVNDTMGHAAGDHVLQQAARVMVEETREIDTVARVGGDEFVFIFDRLLDRDKLSRIANRLIRRLEDPIPYNGRTCRISASAGTVLSSDLSGLDPSHILESADRALYAAKNAGRGCHHFFDPKMMSGQKPEPDLLLGQPAGDRGQSRENSFPHIPTGPIGRCT
jgi:diguanylate cyclase (GGDEF)-like protein